ncbi:MAG: hypothetical protein R2695_19880 [Acidimicrobiales bacterium]
MTSRLERLLTEALDAAGTRVEPSPDLFARIKTGIDTDRRLRRRRHRRLVSAGAIVLGVVGTLTALALQPFTRPDTRQGEPHMEWWILELAALVVLAAIALDPGPVHQALRPQLCRRRLPIESVDRQELHRPDGLRLLPHLHRLHPLHDHDRSASRLDGRGGRRADRAHDRADRWDPADHRAPARGEPAGAADHRAPADLNRRLDQQMREVSARDLGDRDFDQPQGDGDLG